MPTTVINFSASHHNLRINAYTYDLGNRSMATAGRTRWIVRLERRDDQSSGQITGSAQIRNATLVESSAARTADLCRAGKLLVNLFTEPSLAQQNYRDRISALEPIHDSRHCELSAQVGKFSYPREAICSLRKIIFVGGKTIMAKDSSVKTRNRNKDYHKPRTVEDITERNVQTIGRFHPGDRRGRRRNRGEV